MSELINNSTHRKELLRHLFLRLHEGDNPEVLRQRLREVLKGIPYNEVVEVTQKLPICANWKGTSGCWLMRIKQVNRHLDYSANYLN